LCRFVKILLSVAIMRWDTICHRILRGVAGCTPLTAAALFERQDQHSTVELVMAVMFKHEASVLERTGLSLVHPTSGNRNKA
jgi:hypothetical protein